MAPSNADVQSLILERLDGLDKRMHDHFLEAGKLHSKIDNLCADLDDYSVKVDVLYDSFQRMQGVTKFIQVIFLVIAPIAAAIHWVKDHIKW
jgi:hypothetical protein